MLENNSQEEVSIEIHVESDGFSLDVFGEAYGDNRRKAIEAAMRGLAELAGKIAGLADALNREHLDETIKLN